MAKTATEMRRPKTRASASVGGTGKSIGTRKSSGPKMPENTISSSMSKKMKRPKRGSTISNASVTSGTR